MPPARKRKAPPSETASSPASKVAKSTTSSKVRDATSSAKSKPQPEIVGGLNGDYRITGSEDSSSYTTFTIPADNDKVIPCQLHGDAPKQSSSKTPKDSNRLLIFTHGAGGGIENPATQLFAQGYASDRIPVLLFQGTMNLKNRAKSFQMVFDHCSKTFPGCEIAVGGRSMGARAAVLLAQEQESIKKLVLVSYPLASPKGEMRDQILVDLTKDKDVLFLSGNRDNMCDIAQLHKVCSRMEARSRVVSVKNGDHGMSLVGSVKNKGKAVEEIRKRGGKVSADWVSGKDNSIQEAVELSWDGEDGAVVVSGKTHHQSGSSEHEDLESSEDLKDAAATDNARAGQSKSHLKPRKKQAKSRKTNRLSKANKSATKRNEARDDEVSRETNGDSSMLRRSSRKRN